MKLKKLSKTSYIEAFICTGSKCEFTCCGGWNIAIDKETYPIISQAIKAIGPKYMDLICENKDSSLDELFGKLNLRSSFCPLLDEDKLCSLQKSKGENSIPLACYNFPRVNNYINGTIQLSARLSCPEIAKLVLLKKESILITNEKYKKKTFKITRNPELSVNIFIKDRKDIKKYFFLIQEFLFELIKSRNISIEERLQLVIKFMSKLTNKSFIFSKRGLKKIFSSIESEIKLEKIYSFTDTNYQYEFIIGNIITEHIISLKNNNYPDEFKKVYDIFYNSEKISLQSYENTINNQYKNFSKKHEYIVENFLLNWIITEAFPFKSESLHYETVRLIVNFILIRFLIVSELSTKENLSVDEVIDIIFYYTRVFGNTEFPTFRNSYTANTNSIYEILNVLVAI